MTILRVALAGIALLGATPLRAEVVHASPQGFEVRGNLTTTASNVDVWYLLIEPGRWWSSEYSWSGDAHNLSLDARAGGCFCEVLPMGGSVEHMRVVYAAPGEMLRMSGGLGPLQGEAINGTLTVELKPVATGTLVNWTYVVGGHSRLPLAGSLALWIWS